MEDSKYLVIGDGVAGDSAAEEIRRRDSEGSITVLTDDSEPLYNRITLKTYMKGKMPKKFTRIRNESWYEDKGIELHLNTLVESVDSDNKIVRTSEGEEFGYERLLVATGGMKKYLPQDDGFDNSYYMWDWNDADRIKNAAEDNDKAVVVGAGLLGIDLAVIFAENGCEVDYLMRGSHWWRRGISQKGAEIVHEKLREKGVNIVTDCAVDEIKSENGRATEVVGSNDDSYSCDVLGIAIGRDPRFGFIDADKNGRGCLETDRYLHTSEEDVYAAGDLVNYYSPVFDKRREGGTWDHSAAMGRAAGRNMADNDEEFYFVPSYGVGHFDVQLLSLGENYGNSVSKRVGDRYLELFFEEDRVVGAVLIEDVSPGDAIREAIEDKETFDDKEECLNNFWNMD